MTDAEKYLLRQAIASIIDHPSVYMGGPSPNSVRKAIRIIEHMESEWTVEAVAIRIKEDADRVATWRTSPWDSLERT